MAGVDRASGGTALFKFTKHGTVGLKVTREFLGGRECLVFAVADTGIGMTAEQLSRLFLDFN